MRQYYGTDIEESLSDWKCQLMVQEKNKEENCDFKALLLAPRQVEEVTVSRSADNPVRKPAVRKMAVCDITRGTSVYV